MEKKLENIESREPILDQKSSEQYRPDQIDRQWRLLTEAIRRDILTDPEIRKVAIDYVSSPVNESLPKAFLDKLSSDDRIARLKERYGDEIGSYLELEPIPENQINPDIRNATSLTKPEDIIKMLQKLYGTDTQEYYKNLRRYAESGMFLHGITAQERVMIAQRYRFARDVKLLALQAETTNLGESIQIDSHGEVVLPSGIFIRINIEDETKRKELLNPQNWKKRRQLKDRVYEIEVGSSKYILKEKKTTRHTDTKKNGHEHGLTSFEEFQTAQHFQENGVEQRGNIKVDWEKPVATVTFPDGFQFTIFEYEDDLLEENSATQILTQKILEHKEQFEAEFTTIQAMAEKFKDHPKVFILECGDTESCLKTILQRLGLRNKQTQKLSFEEFAITKALRMSRQAINLMQEVIIKNGYTNSDLDGYSFKVNTRDGKLQLEIFGFDFEYFSKIDQDEKKIEEKVKKHKNFEQELESRGGVSFLYWNDGSPVTRMQQAAYFAMLEAEGLLLETSMQIGVLGETSRQT